MADRQLADDLVARARAGARQARARVLERRRIAIPSQPELVLLWLSRLDMVTLHRSMCVCHAWHQIGLTEPSLHASIDLPPCMSSRQKRELTDARLARLIVLANGGLLSLRLPATPKVTIAGACHGLEPPTSGL